MSSPYPQFPVPEGSSGCDGIELEAMPAYGLPKADLTISLFFDGECGPHVEVATLRLLWDIPAPPWPKVTGRLPKHDVRTLDSGLAIVEFDSLGRVSNIEVTGYVSGSRWLPETVALSHQEAQKDPRGHHLILTCVATIMRYWPAFEAKWRRNAKAAESIEPRLWSVAESGESFANRW